MADRLTNMPESLRLRILSSLDARHAVQTSMLSKSWVSVWTSIPILKFSSYGFKKLPAFDKFVTRALSFRDQSVKLDKLTFNRGGKCSAKILKKVFDYAFSHGVKELEAWIYYRGNKAWPVCVHTSSDSLTNLKLQFEFEDVLCPFLGPRSGSFKNLTNLHLKRVIITDVDPFSGFPALEKLTLIDCYLKTGGKTLNVHALQLSELTILWYELVNRFELMTPKLRFFMYRGFNFPQLKTHHGGLSILDTAVIDFHRFCLPNHENILFDHLLMLFNTLYTAKSLTLFSSVVQVLSLFPDELVNRCSPFQDMKCLKLDLVVFTIKSC